MERFFNTAGPMIEADHYCIDPLSRVDWEDIQKLIRDKRYFVMHAPRQTGKTSTLLAMMHALNNEGRYACAYANIEIAQAARSDVSQGIPAVCSAVSRSVALYLKRPDLKQWFLNECIKLPPQDQLFQLLNHWVATSEKPTVLFIDEIDALVGDTLVSVLRQIRAGYAQRPEEFPQSIVLCGVRDVRDYRIHQSGGEIITGGSAFNIKTESLRMGNFSPEESKALWLQHTRDTGQVFDDAIFPELWEDTYGQPWLINALGYEITWKLRRNRDRSRKITLQDYNEAREELIQSRATHLDQLVDKLQEPRVFSVISELLASEEDIVHAPPADVQYVSDLGLIRTRPSIVISNRIYREVIPRELTWSTQVMIGTQETEWYVTETRALDIPKLLSAFQQFFRTHADTWIEGFSYKEAGPQLLLQAFLQRIVNGGGYINREYGLGRKRTDLFIEWPLDEAQGMHGPLQRIVIEIKLRRGAALETLIAKGLEQTADYARRAGAAEAHLIIIDRDPVRPWDEKIWRRDESHASLAITVWGA
ncbi:MAG: AAA-like domain-containing protein [Oscillospiraceae bacterium]|nr:AAA-like domain-containing protein [Oscillospiraceae bacterium]